MKFDLDCVRNILIALEDSIMPDKTGATPKEFTAEAIQRHPCLKNYSPEQIMYTIRIMNDGKPVSFAPEASGNKLQFTAHPMNGITCAGHQYLAAIRDDNIWKNALKKLLKQNYKAIMPVMKQNEGA